MKSVDILRDEHDAVLAVLDQLERAATAAEHGTPVPADVFADMQEFFSIFVDHCHHRKEEAGVFPRLVSVSGGAALIERLESEHEEGRRLANEFAAAVAAYVPGDRDAGARLAQAARAYGAALRQHIDAETTELYPAMEAALAEVDTAIAAEFDRIEIEEIGPGTHERLHGMIDSLPGRIPG